MYNQSSTVGSWEENKGSGKAQAVNSMMQKKTRVSCLHALRWLVLSYRQQALLSPRRLLHRHQGNPATQVTVKSYSTGFSPRLAKLSTPQPALSHPRHLDWQG